MSHTYSSYDGMVISSHSDNMFSFMKSCFPLPLFYQQEEMKGKTYAGTWFLWQPARASLFLKNRIGSRFSSLFFVFVKRCNQIQSDYFLS